MRYAICNETFEGWDHTRVCRVAADLGYTGLEVAPFPLAPPEADFLTTCAEAVDLLDQLDHPNFRLHQDVKAMASEAVPIPDLIRQYAAYTHHFHANDYNRRGPGFGATDFVPIFRALR